MKTYTITLKNQTIEYKLEYKNIRSLYMKVEKGKLRIHAPMQMPLQHIEKYIFQYQDRLLQQIEQYQPFAVYEDNGYVDIFSSQYRIILRDIGQRKCSLHDDCLYVYHHDIEKTVQSFLKQVLMDYIEERVIYYLSYFFDLDKPSILIKRYKGRWGSCFYKMNQISFNNLLVHLDKELVDYVIVHELTHFLHPNHSKLFYQEMAQRMPDYKERQNRLKRINI